MQNFIKQAENACIFKPVFEILFGGYATPTKCVAFWRLALNSYSIFLFSKAFCLYFLLQFTKTMSVKCISDMKYS